VRLAPELSADCSWIDFDRFPPSLLIAPAVQLAVMQVAQRNRELVTDLAAQGPRLSEPKMVGI
jgi:hypothetical protein